MIRLLLLVALACWPLEAARGQTSAKPAAAGNPAEAAGRPVAVAPVETSPHPAAAEADADGGDETRAADACLIGPNEKDKQAIEDRIKGLDGAALDEADRKRAGEFCQQALESFAQAEEQYAQACELQQRLANAATDLEAAQKPLLPFADTAATSLAELETWTANNEKWLRIYKEELAEREAWLARRLQRLPELPKLLGDANKQIKKLAAERAALGDGDPATPLVAAQALALDQRLKLLAATVQTLELELRDYQERAALVQLERDRKLLKISQKEKRLAQLREETNRRREHEAQQQARLAAEDAAVKRPEAIAELARQNAVLAEERTRVAASITRVTQQLAAAGDRRSTLEREFARAQQQDTVVELSDFIGQLLRQQQAKLPNVRELRRGKGERDAERSGVQFRLYELQDMRASLADLDGRVDDVVARTGVGTTFVVAEVRDLLLGKRETLEQLMRNYDEYLLNLTHLDAEEATLTATTEAYGAFIAERVLWIRSCHALGAADLKPASGALAWSLDVQNWRDVVATLADAGTSRPAQTMLAACGLLALAAVQRPARRRLAALGAEAAKRSCTQLRPTVDAVLLTAVLALPWPALAAALAWLLDGPRAESEFVRALAAALRCTALVLLLLETIRHVCRNDGLADSHFGWPRPCLLHLRRRIRRLTLLGLLPTLWLAALEVQSENPLYGATLGRALFLGVMLMLAASFWRLLAARNSPFRGLVLSAGAWLKPLQLAWRPAAAALPAALAVLAAAGYYYTAQQAALRLLQTSALLLAVLTVGGLTRRWLLVNRRQLAREQARQRRLQLAAAEGETADAADHADETIDLAAVSEQTQKLVRTFLAAITVAGFLLIWGPLLPAVGYLGRAPLIPGVVLLTWGQALAFLAVLGATYVAVRDIPALLELVILQHLPLDSGFRYAFSTLTRYVLAAVGLTIAFKILGGQWEKIQWLAAAMSVGLGFGLQEIFANFVSGIIILFERPIRVGDVITLGETTGQVNRIRMRATTIIDWDRKEYVVPNKDLVTGRLLNWTLSDHTNRLSVLVGVAYGSDTDLACQLMLDAAREQPEVLAEPAPRAFFDTFGDSSLNLKLQVFLPTLDNRWVTIHKLNSAIDRKFKEAGLEIPFPKRDLHVRFHGDAGVELAPRRTPDARPAKSDRQGAA